MRRVMAQGTFDVVHPGHVQYFRESAGLGDELVVVIARDERVRDRKDLLFDHTQRREIVAALAPVDDARLGTTGDPFDIVGEVDPDVITIGYDQPYETDELGRLLAERGHDAVDVIRTSGYEPGDEQVVSSSRIKERITRAYGEAVFHSIRP